jgi:hypothetical protein
MPRLNRSARRCLALVVGLLALLVAADSLAQSRDSGFAGRWQKVLPGVVDGDTPTIIRQVAITDRTLAIQDVVPGSSQRPPIDYRLAPAVLAEDIVAGRAGGTFTWLTADRLEVHDLLIDRGSRTAVTATWELRDGGRTLRIRRTLRSLDDSMKPPDTRIATYRRVD